MARAMFQLQYILIKEMRCKYTMEKEVATDGKVVTVLKRDPMHTGLPQSTGQMFQRRMKKCMRRAHSTPDLFAGDYGDDVEVLAEEVGAVGEPRTDPRMQHRVASVEKKLDQVMDYLQDFRESMASFAQQHQLKIKKNQ